MRRLTRREIVLLTAVLVGGLIYLWIYSNREMSAREAALGDDADHEQIADTAPEIPIHLVAQVIDDYDRHGRDLFQYSKPPMTQAEIDRLRRQREAEEARRRAAEEARKKSKQDAAKNRRTKPAPPPRTTEPSGPSPPRIPFRYIGYLGPANNRIAVFQEGDELHLARKGEALKEDFKVVDIRYESVVMGYTAAEFETRTRELPMTSD
jgi:hypothetical protein